MSSYRHDKSAFASPGGGVTLLRYLDVVLVVVAAPILLLMGVSAVGYGVGAGAWIALRAVGVGVDRVVNATADPRREISLRLAYMISRLFLLALAVILVRKGSGKDAALTALLVIVFAFTVQLTVSFIDRPRSK
jgi:hypothetical protein